MCRKQLCSCAGVPSLQLAAAATQKVLQRVVAQRDQEIHGDLTHVSGSIDGMTSPVSPGALGVLQGREAQIIVSVSPTLAVSAAAEGRRQHAVVRGPI